MALGPKLLPPYPRWCETDLTDPNTENAGVKGKIHALQKKVSYHISGLEGGNGYAVWILNFCPAVANFCHSWPISRLIANGSSWYSFIALAPMCFDKLFAPNFSSKSDESEKGGSVGQKLNTHEPQ